MMFLITGATGWLGRRVAVALTEGNSEMGAVGVGGHSVRALVPPNEASDELASLGVEVIRGDVTDRSAANRLVAGASAATLIHLAGVIHPTRGTREFIAVNVEGTQNIVLAASNGEVDRIIVMSSNSPIGASKDHEKMFDECSPYKPYMQYGQSKRLMEEWLRARAAAAIGPPTTIVRAPWFYGPGQPARQTSFFRMVRQGKFPIVGSGQARRSMGYVDSLAYGLLLAANSTRATGATYWLADDRPYSFREIVSTVKSVLGDDFGLKVSSKNLRLPGVVSDLARLADFALQRTGFYQQELHVLSELNLTIACTIDKAKRELGYRPLVSLREGMRRSVQWCISKGLDI